MNSKTRWVHFVEAKTIPKRNSIQYRIRSISSRRTFCPRRSESFVVREHDRNRPVKPLLPNPMHADSGSRHALWSEVWRVLPPAVVGIVIGFLFFGLVPSAAFALLIGWIVFALVLLQLDIDLCDEAFVAAPVKGSLAGDSVLRAGLAVKPWPHSA